MQERTGGQGKKRVARYSKAGYSKAVAVVLTVMALNPLVAYAESNVLERQLERQEIKEIVTDISAEVPNGYIDGSLEMASDTLESLFGISPDMYDTFYGEFSPVENSIDTFIVVKSTDKEVENLFNDYVYKLESQASLVDVKQVENAMTERKGEYIIFSLLKTKEENEKAIEIVVNGLR